MIDIVIILILVSIVGSIILYYNKQKKCGNTCIGCPNAKTCGSHSCTQKD